MRITTIVSLNRHRGQRHWCLLLCCLCEGELAAGGAAEGAVVGGGVDRHGAGAGLCSVLDLLPPHLPRLPSRPACSRFIQPVLEGNLSSGRKSCPYLPRLPS
jgi:hypothetical protein